VQPTPLLTDTHPDIAARQMARWRAMSPSEKLELVRALNLSLLELERAGIRMRQPGITDQEIARIVADRRLGVELAEKVYGPRRGP